MEKFFFLSHSTKDAETVIKIAEGLGKDYCWVYQWEIKGGEDIFKFDKGISDSRIFVLFWSKNASLSEWVNEEVNIARYRWITEKGFRPVVVKLDKMPLPIFLKYKLYLDIENGIESIVNSLNELKGDLTSSEILYGKTILKDYFQDRDEYFDKLETIVASGAYNGVVILGLDGIGKTSFIKRANAVLFSNLNPIWIDLKVASTPVRLLSAISKPFSISIDVEEAGTVPEEVWRNKILPEIVESKKTFIVLDNLTLPGRDPVLKGKMITSLIKTICEDLSGINKPGNPNIIVNSQYIPDFLKTSFKNFGQIILGDLEIKDIKRALKYHLSIASHLDYSDAQIFELAKRIRGYPLAIILVANRVAEQGIELLLEDQTLLRQMNIELVQDLFSGLDINDNEREILVTLATTSQPLTMEQLKMLFSDKWKEIGNIKNKQLLDPTSENYRLHPILSDYIKSTMATSSEIVNVHSKLASIFEKEWKSAPKYSAISAQYGSLTYYHSISAGKFKESEGIKVAFLVEAKDAAIELYRRREYDNALKYLENAKKIFNYSDPIYDFYSALCLNRIGRTKEAIPILEELINAQPQVSRYHHSLGICKKKINDLNGALSSFRSAVSSAKGRGKIVPLVSLADLLFEMRSKDNNHLNEAKSLILQALDLSPNDSDVVSIAAKILMEVGEEKKALSILYSALNESPSDEHLQHRIGMILKEMGKLRDAQSYLENATTDPTLRYSITALADVYLLLGEVEWAEETLDKFEGNKSNDVIYLVTKGNILRVKNELDDAEIYLEKAIKLSPKNPIPYGVMANIKLAKANKAISQNLRQEGLICLDEANKYIELGLEKEPENEGLLSTKHQIDDLNLKLGFKK